MAKRISETQRLVAFAMNVTEVELIAAMETLKAIQASRFPKAKKPRKSSTKPLTEASKGAGS